MSRELYDKSTAQLRQDRDLSDAKLSCDFEERMFFLGLYYVNRQHDQFIVRF